MRVLIVKPMCKPEVQEIDGSLESMQNTVDGYIRIIFPFSNPVALVCNEDGISLGLQPNRCLQDEDGRLLDIVCGTFFLCGTSQSDSEPDLIDLSYEQIKKFSTLFHCPEIFFEADGQIFCFSIDEGD